VAELVSIKCDVIVAADAPAVVAARKATSLVPIVAPILFDPVHEGLVESYSRPGGNVTGILVFVKDLWSRNFEIASELIPSPTAIGLLINPTNPAHAAARHDVEAAGAATGIRVVVAEVAGSSELEPAVKGLIREKVQAALVVGDPVFAVDHERVAELSATSHLATIWNERWFIVEAGGLISYGVSLPANQRRAAYFVDKILKGTKAADLPVEFPTKLAMVVNLKTAKALGLTIPQSLLARADEVIE